MKYIQISFLFLFILSCSTPRHENSTTNINSTFLRREPPRIDIAGDSLNSFVEISNLDIHVEVDQNIVTTTMDILFENNQNRILSGELNFPLGEDEYVIGMAMEVNGKLRDAVPVEKAQGRIAYESVVRRKVDPALAELTKGNVFKTQVYPIPAKGFKRVVIKYQSQLITVNEALLVQIPLQYKKAVKKFDLVIEVKQNKVKPLFQENQLTNLEFVEWQDIFKAEKHDKNYLPNHNLIFQIPSTKNQSFVLTKAKNEQENYFHATIYSNQFQSLKKITPKSILVYWDASYSGSNRNIEKERELLLSYMNSITKQKIKIVTFANEIIDEKTFSSDDIENIDSHIKSIVYDGATNLSTLKLNQKEYDQILLFTDGIHTIGNSQKTLPNTPIYAVNSATGSDYTLLQNWCESSGGNFINLESLLPEKALSLLQEVPLHFIGFETTSGLIKEHISTISNGNKFSISGITAGDCNLNLQFGYGKDVTLTLPLVIQKEVDSPLAEYLWAMNKINRLNVNYDENKSEITSLGKKYKIITKNTSLIILDDVSDYVTHGITPPEELLSQYNKLLKEKTSSKEEEADTHIKEVIDLFEERKQWWKTDFALKKEKSVRKPMGALTDSVSGTYNWSGLTFALETSSEMSVSDEELSVSAGENNAKVKENAQIEIQKFESNEAYSKEIKSWKSDYFSKYITLRADYKNVPIYYIDVAQLFFDKGLKKEAIRVLSNLAEIELENQELMRALAYKLKEWKQYDLAIDIFEKITEMRAEEPQSFRDLGLVYYLNREPQKAIEQLYKVVNTKWDSRFPEVEMIALAEINNIISSSSTKLNISFIDKRLIYSMPCDIRIIIEWNYDNSDIDLWVTDPMGEKCMYNHNRTNIGGRMSRDFTGGYGPEEFLLKKAISGKYKIEANYYGNSREKLTGPATISAKLTTHFGTSLEKTEEIVVRLKTAKEVVYLGNLTYQ